MPRYLLTAHEPQNASLRQKRWQTGERVWRIGAENRAARSHPEAYVSSFCCDVNLLRDFRASVDRILTANRPHTRTTAVLRRRYSAATTIGTASSTAGSTKSWF